MPICGFLVHGRPSSPRLGVAATPLGGNCPVIRSSLCSCLSPVCCTLSEWCCISCTILILESQQRVYYYIVIGLWWAVWISLARSELPSFPACLWSLAALAPPPPPPCPHEPDILASPMWAPHPACDASATIITVRMWLAIPLFSLGIDLVWVCTPSGLFVEPKYLVW